MTNSQQRFSLQFQFETIDGVVVVVVVVE